MVCPKCGKELLETATLCTTCGWKSQKWENSKEQGKYQHKALVSALVGIVVVIILATLGIVAILLGGK